MYNYSMIDSWTVANRLARWSEICKKHDWKIDEEDIWERSRWVDSPNGEGCEDIFVSFK